MATPRRPLLGHLLVTEGLVTKAQLRDALRVQAESPHTPFERVLVDRKVITQAQLNAVLDTYTKKYRLGTVLVEMKVLTDEQLRRALQHQSKTGRRLGDALLELSLVTERQMKEALARQFGFRFVDLDRVSLDRSLAAFVDKSYAREHRVVPIARTPDRLTVAMDDPTDADVIEALAASTGCEIDVVTSTSAPFSRAFARLYEGGPEAAVALPQPEPQAGAPPRPAPTPAAPAEPSAGPGTVRVEGPPAVSAAGLPDLAARHAETERALAELHSAPEALRGERDASVRAVGDLAARHAGTARALAELQAAHEALRRERDAELRAAHEALRREASGPWGTSRRIRRRRGGRWPSCRRRTRRCGGSGT